MYVHIKTLYQPREYQQRLLQLRTQHHSLINLLLQSHRPLLILFYIYLILLCIKSVNGQTTPCTICERRSDDFGFIYVFFIVLLFFCWYIFIIFLFLSRFSERFLLFLQKKTHRIRQSEASTARRQNRWGIVVRSPTSIQHTNQTQPLSLSLSLTLSVSLYVIESPHLHMTHTTQSLSPSNNTIRNCSTKF